MSKERRCPSAGPPPATAVLLDLKVRVLPAATGRRLPAAAAAAGRGHDQPDPRDRPDVQHGFGPHRRVERVLVDLSAGGRTVTLLHPPFSM